MSSSSRHPQPRRASLVDELLRIAKYRKINEKSLQWFKNLLCIEILYESSVQLRLVRISPSLTGLSPYIAVSYPWSGTPGLESESKGAYRLIGADVTVPRRNEVRDEILARIINYACHKGVKHFWIDGECIPQHQCPEKDRALNSMDLVYSRSKYPLGLLAVILGNQEEVDTLQDLMEGAFIKSRHNLEYPELSDASKSDSKSPVFQLLRRLCRDRWWSRAWIFQEEYLASTRMHLLIRHKMGLWPKQQFSFPGREICIKATSFREQATLYLLACKKQPDYGQNKKQIALMLKTFGKYNLLYHSQHDMRTRSMSSRIVVDIQRRIIRNPFERLPIIANACDYAVRLDGMNRKRCNVLSCCLALSLLNGEILRNPKRIKRLPTDMWVSDFMQHAFFNKFDPPVRENHLTYLKKCRLSEVTLVPQGISTKGHIWILDSTIKVNLGSKGYSWIREERNLGPREIQKYCLLRLLDVLRSRGQKCQVLADELERCFHTDAGEATPDATKKHNHTMLGPVIDAIREYQPLRLGCLQGQSHASGIFSGAQTNITKVFTSWHTGPGIDGKERESHVSLGVHVKLCNDQWMLETVQWINGLAFPGEHEQLPVTFRWPSAWL
jgi:hypothetical protein